MVYNPYIVVPLATWAIAQIAKFAVATFKGRLDLRYLYASGGMPSVHSAVVCSLATTAYLLDGAGSHLFGFIVIFAAVVMYDSLGVRRSSGEQSVALNMLIGSLGRGKIKLDQPELRLKEVLGHKPGEVGVGAVLGTVLGLLFNYDRIGPLVTFMQTLPSLIEVIVYTSVFAALLVLGALTRLIIRRRNPKSPSLRRVSNQVLTMTQVTGWIGLVIAALQFEHASYLAWRLWALLILAAAIVWGINIFAGAVRQVPPALVLEADVARKSKWLKFGRNRKK